MGRLELAQVEHKALLALDLDEAAALREGEAPGVVVADRHLDPVAPACRGPFRDGCVEGGAGARGDSGRDPPRGGRTGYRAAVRSPRRPRRRACRRRKLGTTRARAWRPGRRDNPPRRPDPPGSQRSGSRLRSRAVRGLARARHGRPRRQAGGDLRRARRRRSRRLLEVLVHWSTSYDRPPRPDRGQAGLARPRRRARALKATQIAWAKANGYEQLRTRNEQRNEPIRRLNERFGYRPAPGRI